VLHRIETGFGREEDIDLLEHPIKKRKHDLSFRRRGFMGSSIYVTLEEFEYHVRFPENKK
jgi:hypothetical protein